MDIVKIIGSIENLFRYFLTGIAFTFIYNLSKSSTLQIPPLGNEGNVVYIFILAAGMIIYSIHRIIYWFIIDFILFLLKWSPLVNFCEERLPRNLFKMYGCYSESLGEFHKSMVSKGNKKVSNYLYYKTSIIHFGLIVSEITFFIHFLSSNDCSIFNQNKYSIVSSAIILWGVSIINYISTNIESKRIHHKNLI